MKRTGILMALLLLLTNAYAQKMADLDKSPMDMVYYPHDFAHDRKFDPASIGDMPAIVRVIYSRPAKKDREIFGKLIPYNKVWRAGANEATEIKFYRDVMIQGNAIKAGTYSLFAIPNANEWTIIFNSDLDVWGAYSYDQKQDVARITVPVMKYDKPVENFSIRFRKGKDNEAVMMMVWDTTLIELSISF